MNKSSDATADDGFTLVEMLVAMVVFSIFMGAVVSFFIGSLSVTRTVQESTNNTEDIARAVEVMNRTLTVAKAPTSATPAIKAADTNKVEFYANFFAGKSNPAGPTYFKFEFNAAKKCIEQTRIFAVAGTDLTWPTANAEVTCLALTQTAPVFKYFDRPYMKEPNGSVVAPITLPAGGLSDTQSPAVRSTIVAIEGDLGVGDPNHVDVGETTSTFRATLVNSVMK